MKALTVFSRRSEVKDGRASHCKACTAAKRLTNREKESDYGAAYYRANKERVRARHTVWYAAWSAARPELAALLQKARNSVSRAVRSGKLAKATDCQHCGRSDVRITAAHRNYEPPYLDVLWLCWPCHMRWDHAEPKMFGQNYDDAIADAQRVGVAF